MRYLSLFSGIEAASAAWKPLGWSPVAFSEVDPFASAVLAHHYPDVTNLGDVTKYEEWPEMDIDLVCGGSPCFPADTLILTRRRLVRIEDVVEGDEVYTHECRWRKVVRTGHKTSATVMVYGQGKSGLETTAEHPFYARRMVHRWDNGVRRYVRRFDDPPEWVAANTLSGYFWGAPVQWDESVAPPIDRVGRESTQWAMTPTLAWLIGRWLGDGWCRVDERRGCVYIASGKHKAEAVREALTKCGTNFYEAEMRTTIRFQITSRPLARWLMEQFGHLAHGKTLPSWVYGWDLRESLLKGYLSADGSEQAASWRIATVSDGLGVGVSLLAQSLGYAVSRRLVKTKPTKQIEGRTVNQRDWWQITIYKHSRSSVEIGNHRWGLVRKVLPGRDNVTVYNLEVEEDNSYVADGITVHNCQSFSIAGLRKGLRDPRGNLMLTFGSVLAKYRPRWFIWENVPGVLSSHGGRDFAAFLGLVTGQKVEVPPDGKWRRAGAISGIDSAYGIAWRVLDAQFTRTPGFPRAVPQRRQRVWVVGSLGDWRRAGAVLFDSESVLGNPPPERKTGQKIAGDAGTGVEVGCRPDSIMPMNSGKDYKARPTDVAQPLMASGPVGGNQGGDYLVQRVHCAEVRGTLTRASNAGGTVTHQDVEQGELVVQRVFDNHREDSRYNDVGEVCPTVTAKYGTGGGNVPLVAKSHWDGGPHPTLNASFGDKQGLENQYIDGGAGLFVAFTCKDSGQDAGENVAPTLRGMNGVDGNANGGGQVAVAHTLTSACEKGATEDGTGRGVPIVAQTMGNDEEIAGALCARPVRAQSVQEAVQNHLVATQWRVRRLTEAEAEKLQGFQPGWTQIPWGAKKRKVATYECPECEERFDDDLVANDWSLLTCPRCGDLDKDTPPAIVSVRTESGIRPADQCPAGRRYKAIGNSWAVNCAEWIGRRIQMVEDLDI